MFLQIRTEELFDSLPFEDVLCLHELHVGFGRWAGIALVPTQVCTDIEVLPSVHWRVGLKVVLDYKLSGRVEGSRFLLPLFQRTHKCH